MTITLTRHQADVTYAAIENLIDSLEADKNECDLKIIKDLEIVRKLIGRNIQ